MQTAGGTQDVVRDGKDIAGDALRVFTEPANLTAFPALEQAWRKGINPIIFNNIKPLHRPRESSSSSWPTFSPPSRPSGHRLPMARHARTSAGLAPCDSLPTIS